MLRAKARATVRAEARTAARVTRHTDARLVALYLDMLAAERGAGKNTLAAYSRDLEDFSAYLKAPAAPSPKRTPPICAPISASFPGAACA